MYVVENCAIASMALKLENATRKTQRYMGALMWPFYVLGYFPYDVTAVVTISQKTLMSKEFYVKGSE